MRKVVEVEESSRGIRSRMLTEKRGGMEVLVGVGDGERGGYRMRSCGGGVVAEGE